MSPDYRLAKTRYLYCEHNKNLLRDPYSHDFKCLDCGWTFHYPRYVAYITSIEEPQEPKKED